MEELQSLLSDYEQAITECVIAELQRIKRAVAIAELSATPFNRESVEYLSCMRLDHFSQPVIDTVLTVNGHCVTAFLCDNLISHRNMITLIRSLRILRLNTHVEECPINVFYWK